MLARRLLPQVDSNAPARPPPWVRSVDGSSPSSQELGHVHADGSTLDPPLPADRRAHVVEAGRAKDWFSNWVTKQLGSRADADDGIALLTEARSSDRWSTSASTNSYRVSFSVRRRLWRLGEPLDEAKCRVGDLAPAAVDRQCVSASLDLDDLGHGRVALLVFV
jgi:hypothetical protein